MTLRPDQTPETNRTEPAMGAIIPVPVSVEPAPTPYALTEHTVVRVDPDAADAVVAIAERLATLLRRSTAHPLPVRTGPTEDPTGIILTFEGADPDLGPEGYDLTVTASGVTVRATAPAGLHNATQTLRQLLPAAVEATTPQPGPWLIPGGHIIDHPRFAYRGAMLDVARHFFPVADVERYIDEIALYKINHLHLHLTDDQGWRIAINSWPNLTKHGATTEVGGGPGGHYTQADYRHLVAYAQAQNIAIIPEFDTPGHTNAALSSYPELNTDGAETPGLYTGIEVGFSSLDANKDVTYAFVDDVVRELAELTPGPYLHLGGDEAQSTTDEDYTTFAAKMLPIAPKHNKIPITWHEITKTNIPASTIIEFWGTTGADPMMATAAANGNKIILAPATKSYLDQKYTEDTKLGLQWAAFIEVQDAYDWNPGTYLENVPESAILGVEAPLWTETATTMADLEYLAFPRLPAIAELAWSPEAAHNWPNFQSRLAAHSPRWTAMSLNYHPSPQIPWPAE